jgi:hypothetical protein
MGQNSMVGGRVKINDYTLVATDLTKIKNIYGVTPVPGEYWYDSRSGAFGVKGGPAIGVMYPGHLFGTLSADASQGNSGVFINGRELQQSEAVPLARLFGYPAPIPGKYWLNANGDIGIAGYSLAFGNIYLAISQARQNQASGGSNFWSQGLYSGGNYYTGANGRPNQGYVSVPGYGPVSHGMN